MKALVPGLLRISCAYLALPYLIFFLGWLKWPLAIPATAMLVVCSYYAVRRMPQLAGDSEPEEDSARVRWRHVLLLLVVALVLTALSGAGGYGAQDTDHPKHNAVLKTLVDKPWPAMVSSDRGSFPLVYYTAYYLPAALFGKVAGWNGANHFLYFWTLLGFALSLFWFCILCGRFTWVVLGVFVFFSGLDVVGAALFKFLDLTARPDFGWSTLHPGNIDWVSLRWWNWMIRWWDPVFLRNYSSNMALLFFVPQQALVGWILAGMVGYSLGRGCQGAKGSLIFYWALSGLWAPFVTIGMVPLLVFDFLEGKGSVLLRLKAYWSWLNVCGLVILGVTALYYLTQFSDLPFKADPGSGFGFGHPGMSVWMFLLRMALFLTLEVGVLAWLVWATGSVDGKRDKRLFAAVLLFLVVLPFFRYGGMNDLVMRASIPCLVLLAVFVAKAVLRTQVPRATKAALIAVLAVAAANPVAEIYRHGREVYGRGQLVLVPKEEKVDTFWILNLNNRAYAERSGSILSLPGDTFFRQYVGSPDALFFRWMARPPEAAEDVPREPPGELP